ncbi:uncharacterized protein LOC129927663 [Biomphalaria glabrata]|uniref:Uncharacterized protein LOC129927663 n=1 Tax=Biomphalaria glabrata TaxID=6526 RepID=A0A9W3B2F0_BIOGL|nr:uncharacterized protein LOC129927663 [Biomphalaria glabrata]
MNLIDAQIYLLPICLQIKFRDKRKKYIIMMEKLEGYKYMIRTLKVQKQEKFREKEMYLCDRIKYLHRVQTNHVTQTTKLPCRHLYKYILEDARKTPAPSRHSGHYLHLRCQARRKSLVDCICYYTCWC